MDEILPEDKENENVNSMSECDFGIYHRSSIRIKNKYFIYRQRRQPS